MIDPAARDLLRRVYPILKQLLGFASDAFGGPSPLLDSINTVLEDIEMLGILYNERELTDDGVLESARLWRLIQKREEEENWCEWDTLTAEWQDYVIALRNERDNAIRLLGVSSHMVVDAMDLLKEWLTKVYLAAGDDDRVDLIMRTTTFLERKAALDDDLDHE